jgi:hypothetical protein
MESYSVPTEEVTLFFPLNTSVGRLYLHPSFGDSLPSRLIILSIS